MSRLLLLDTFNFLHRAYHALPKTFKDANGEPTNAIYGVTSMIINILDQVKPNYIVAAMDSIEPTFRLEDFTAYKAHRKPMEEDLSSQIPKVIEVLDAFGIPQVMVNGYEADDITATFVKRYKKDAEIVIVSNDRDLWQLADGNVMIMLPNTKGASEWLSRKEVIARLGFDPSMIADYKGLRGDPSDNIPGVYGIGEKTATALIQEFGSIENIYNNIDKVSSGNIREKLLSSYEQAMMSKKLASLIYDVPFEVELKDCKFSDFNRLRVKQVLEKYNFKSLIKRLGFDETPNSKTKKNATSDEQLSLL